MGKSKYQVSIRPVRRASPELWPGCNYSVSLQKQYGDCQGLSTCVATRADIIRLFERMKESWEGFDSILDRKGDRVTPSNLEFKDETGDMAREEIWGQPRLL